MFELRRTRKVVTFSILSLISNNGSHSAMIAEWPSIEIDLKLLFDGNPHIVKQQCFTSCDLQIWRVNEGKKNKQSSSTDSNYDTTLA